MNLQSVPLTEEQEKYWRETIANASCYADISDQVAELIHLVGSLLSTLDEERDKSVISKRLEDDNAF